MAGDDGYFLVFFVCEFDGVGVGLARPGCFGGGAVLEDVGGAGAGGLGDEMVAVGV